MKLIHHRRNTIEELQSTPTHYGVEIDLRSEGNDVIVQHDPFVPGVLLKDWIKHYSHDILVLNVKEEELEPAITKIMESHSIENYFFLGQSIPSLVQCAQKGERRCATRVSQYEPIEAALLFAKKLDWAWVDSFTHFPLDHVDAIKLKNASFKTYLLSPELYGHDPDKHIRLMADMLRQRNIDADTICTKRLDLWEQEIS